MNSHTRFRSVSITLIIAILFSLIPFPLAMH
jgi:hypothetical protein